MNVVKFYLMKTSQIILTSILIWLHNTRVGKTHPRTSHEVPEGCPESICPFWISREPVAWPWCNLATSLRRPYCSSVNSHSPVGLVSRQWDAVDWACVLCDRRIQNDRTSRSSSSRQCAYPIYSYHAGYFGKASHHSGMSAPYSPDLAPCDVWLLTELKIAIERNEICECNSHTAHKLS